jgi:hypothetical protein
VERPPLADRALSIVLSKPIDIEDDVRWRRLTRTGIVCRGCGERHKGLFDLACDGPEHWPGDRQSDREPNSAVRARTDVLTEDFCVIEGRDHFVRCVLQLPIIGATDQVFGYGVWSTLSPANFNRYLETFDSGAQGDLGPWWATPAETGSSFCTIGT